MLAYPARNGFKGNGNFRHVLLAIDATDEIDVANGIWTIVDGWTAEYLPKNVINKIESAVGSALILQYCNTTQTPIMINAGRPHSQLIKDCSGYFLESAARKYFADLAAIIS